MDFLIHHMLQASARRRPDAEALVHGSQRLSYADVDRKVSGLARGLREGGLQRGDRIGIYLDASVPQTLSIFGVSRAGGCTCRSTACSFPIRSVTSRATAR